MYVCMVYEYFQICKSKTQSRNFRSATEKNFVLTEQTLPLTEELFNRIDLNKAPCFAPNFGKHSKCMSTIEYENSRHNP